MFTKHHVTTYEGHRVIARKQGEWLSNIKVSVALKEPGKKLPRYTGVEMEVGEARRVADAIYEALKATEGV